MTKIDIVHPQDLAAILRIERLSFNEAEAGTAEQYQARINQLADTFLVARDEYDRIAGFIVGPAVDSSLNTLRIGCMKLMSKIASSLVATKRFKRLLLIPYIAVKASARSC